MDTALIEVGDRIRFRAVTRHSDRAVWRVVTGVTWGSGLGVRRIIQVRFHGWGDFQVRNYEITEHERRDQ